MSNKIVLWCGSAPNQKALACRIHNAFHLTAIVIDEKSNAPATAKEGMLKKIFDRLYFRKLYASWSGLQKHYAQSYTEWPDVPVLRAGSINSAEAEAFTRRFDPDLIVVSGTSLVKKDMLGIPARIGMINLHTGLSPYIKGGPNCTNWCIAENKWHLIGNTIMWINSGIDSGNIITSETIDIRDAGSLPEAHIRVMDHAHDLYVRTIRYLLNSSGPYNSVLQKSIDAGHLYLTRMWTKEKKKTVLKNWSRRKSIEQSKEQPITVPLP